MSRCFPFPPPGYEKKARTDEVDPVKKEKEREKKHKKEKKEREKREGKDKKEKERGDGKHREKKDKKEKDRDKKKDKDKDRGDKDKSGAPDEKKVEIPPEGYNAENLRQKKEKEREKTTVTSAGKRVTIQSEGYNGQKLGPKTSHTQSSMLPLESKDSRFVQELGRRIKADERGPENQLAGLFAPADQKSDEKTSITQSRVLPLESKDSRFVHELGRRIKGDERGPENQLAGKFAAAERNSDEKSPVTQCSELPLETKDSRFVQELGRRIKGDERVPGNQLPGKFAPTDRKGDEATLRFGDKDTRKMDIQGSRNEPKLGGNTGFQNDVGYFQNHVGVVQNTVDGKPRPTEKSIEKRVEGKDKGREKEGDDKQSHKRKDKDREKKSKDKGRDKEKKKEEKAKEESELKIIEQLNRSKESNKNELMGIQGVKTPHLPKDSNKIAAIDGTLGKRKESERNGFLHDNDIRPNKLPRPTLSSHSSMENGRKLEPCQNPILIIPDRQAVSNNHKIDNKECNINGVIEAQPFPIIAKKPDQIAESSSSSSKAPHPDSKYLTQILSVPKMDEWLDFDDQDWLFGSDKPQMETHASQYSGKTLPRVWSEALQIDEADVCALPYVIPY